jgi:hypothetical protein
LAAKSSQNGQPVAGSKCQFTTSRTQALSASREPGAAAGAALDCDACMIA